LLLSLQFEPSPFEGAVPVILQLATTTKLEWRLRYLIAAALGHIGRFFDKTSAFCQESSIEDLIKLACDPTRDMWLASPVSEYKAVAATCNFGSVTAVSLAEAFAQWAFHRMCPTHQFFDFKCHDLGISKQQMIDVVTLLLGCVYLQQKREMKGHFFKNPKRDRMMTFAIGRLLADELEPNNREYSHKQLHSFQSEVNGKIDESEEHRLALIHNAFSETLPPPLVQLVKQYASTKSVGW